MSVRIDDLNQAKALYLKLEDVYWCWLDLTPPDDEPEECETHEDQPNEDCYTCQPETPMDKEYRKIHEAMEELLSPAQF